MGDSNHNGHDGRDRAFEMWLEESVPDDVDYVGPKKIHLNEDGTRYYSCESDELNGESDEASDEASEEDGEEDCDEDGDRHNNKDGDEHGHEDGDEADDGAGIEADDDDNENGGSAKRKRKGKRKKRQNSESEDDEDIMERFEYEVQESVSAFVDELSIPRDQIPPSTDEDEGPVVRDRRIRRGTKDKLGFGVKIIRYFSLSVLLLWSFVLILLLYWNQFVTDLPVWYISASTCNWFIFVTLTI